MAFARLARLFGVPPCERVDAREGYALWAPVYPPRPHNPVMEAEQRVVAPMIAAVRPARALDVGTGSGRYLTLLRDAGAQLVVGVDLSLCMLTTHAGAAPRVCGDGCRLPFADGSFDLVCSSLMVGDVPRLEPWMLEAARVLAPGGHLVYSDFHPAWARQRWRRTFRSADGRQYELAYYPHEIDEHLTTIAATGMVVRAIREPRVAGRPAPVVVAIHAVKPPRRAAREVSVEPC
jgi:malonyl-CoA O-methyltransferase